MIKKIHIKNMKSIVDLNLECSNFNLLIGTNSSGKSTVIQALGILAQNTIEKKGINSELVNIGSFEDLKTRFNSTDTVEISIRNDEGEYIACKVKRGIDSLPGLEITTSNDSVLEKFNYANKTYQYLSCDRIGPSNTYEQYNNIDEMIGVKGEYAISYLNRHKTDVIESALCKNKLDYTLGGQVNWWMNYIVGAEIATQELEGTEFIKASYTVGKLSNLRPVNVGAGTSYIISIIITCLSSKQGVKIAIENPEIHLHPTAQSRLAEFLYFISSNGRQIFIESHSDHIFNALRVGFTNGTIDRNDAKIFFIYQSDDAVTKVLNVKIGKYGRVENQQKYLFDQFDEDLNKMIGISQ
ncbi:AAA family ATPase [Butyrivibrio fibrisolvens]|uniref:AAA family ATPase n=1 Tax=Butyrivibrio fibrisolvens TaxID=831 RepID=UPI0003F9F69F|nr:DUF3696 domain-containing protein [Butyrivibrio fibrisolvens]